MWRCSGLGMPNSSTGLRTLRRFDRAKILKARKRRTVEVHRSDTQMRTSCRRLETPIDPRESYISGAEILAVGFSSVRLRCNIRPHFALLDTMKTNEKEQTDNFNQQALHVTEPLSHHLH